MSVQESEMFIRDLMTCVSPLFDLCWRLGIKRRVTGSSCHSLRYESLKDSSGLMMLGGGGGEQFQSDDVKEHRL